MNGLNQWPSNWEMGKRHVSHLLLASACILQNTVSLFTNKNPICFIAKSFQEWHFYVLIELSQNEINSFPWGLPKLITCEEKITLNSTFYSTESNNCLNFTLELVGKKTKCKKVRRKKCLFLWSLTLFAKM